MPIGIGSRSRGVSITTASLQLDRSCLHEDELADEPPAIPTSEGLEGVSSLSSAY